MAQASQGLRLSTTVDFIIIMKVAFLFVLLPATVLVKAEVTFDGMVELSAERSFALTNHQSGESKWVHLGGTFAGITVVRYITQTDTLIVGGVDGERSLHLTRSIVLTQANEPDDEQEWVDVQNLVLKGDKKLEAILLFYQGQAHSLQNELTEFEAIKRLSEQSEITRVPQKELRARSEKLKSRQEGMKWLRSFIIQQGRAAKAGRQ